jgi:hypothetical protein
MLGSPGKAGPSSPGQPLLANNPKLYTDYHWYFDATRPAPIQSRCG